MEVEVNDLKQKIMKTYYWNPTKDLKSLFELLIDTNWGYEMNAIFYSPKYNELIVCSINNILMPDWTRLFEKKEAVWVFVGWL